MSVFIEHYECIIIHMNACIMHYICSLHRKCYHYAPTGPIVADNVFLSYVVFKICGNYCCQVIY